MTHYVPLLIENTTFESGGATMKNILYFILFCYHSYFYSVTHFCHIKNEAEKQTCVADSHLNMRTEMYMELLRLY